jgi:hypothetical protein
LKNYNYEDSYEDSISYQSSFENPAGIFERTLKNKTKKEIVSTDTLLALFLTEVQRKTMDGTQLNIEKDQHVIEHPQLLTERNLLAYLGLQ